VKAGMKAWFDGYLTASRDLLRGIDPQGRDIFDGVSEEELVNVPGMRRAGPEEQDAASPARSRSGCYLCAQQTQAPVKDEMRGTDD
jgi:hypothetical protein